MSFCLLICLCVCLLRIYVFVCVLVLNAVTSIMYSIFCAIISYALQPFRNVFTPSLLSLVNTNLLYPLIYWLLWGKIFFKIHCHYRSMRYFNCILRDTGIFSSRLWLQFEVIAGIWIRYGPVCFVLLRYTLCCTIMWFYLFWCKHSCIMRITQADLAVEQMPVAYCIVEALKK